MFQEYAPEDLKRLQQEELEILRTFIRICEKYKLPYFLIGGTAIGAERHQGFIPWDDDIDVGLLRDDYEKFLSVAPVECQGKYEFRSAMTDHDCLGHNTRMCKVGTKHVTEEHSKWKRAYGIRIDIMMYDNTSPDYQQRKKQYRQLDFWKRLYIMRGVKNPGIEQKGVKGALIRAVCFVMHYVLQLVPVTYLTSQWEKVAKRYHHKTTWYMDSTAFDQEKWIATRDEIFPLHRCKFEDLDAYVMHEDDKVLRRGYGDYMQLPPVEQRANHGATDLDFGKE